VVDSFFVIPFWKLETHYFGQLCRCLSYWRWSCGEENTWE